MWLFLKYNPETTLCCLQKEQWLYVTERSDSKMETHCSSSKKTQKMFWKDCLISVVLPLRELSLEQFLENGIVLLVLTGVQILCLWPICTVGVVLLSTVRKISMWWRKWKQRWLAKVNKESIQPCATTCAPFLTIPEIMRYLRSIWVLQYGLNHRNMLLWSAGDDFMSLSWTGN